MKKRKASSGMRKGYVSADFPGGFLRGKYRARMEASANYARLRPEIAAAFPTDEAVNAALASVLRKQRAVRVAPRPGARSRDK